MPVGGTKRIGAAVPALVVAGLVVGWWVRSTRGQDALKPLPGGSWSTPIAGLLLSDTARPYVDLLDENGPVEGATGVGKDASAFFSHDWTAVTLASSRRDGRTIRTEVRLPSDRLVSLEGSYWFHTLTVGRVVVVPEAAGPDRRYALRILDATGESRFELRLPEPEWIASSPSGRFLAVGTRAGTSVYGDDGHEVCKLDGSSDLGAVSEGHVAIERERGGGVELIVRSLTGDAAQEKAFRAHRGSSLRFDHDGTLLAHSSPTEVLVLDLRSGEPGILDRRTVKGEQSWRDVAFDRSGNLAASWIRIERASTSETEESTHPGRALVGVEVAPARPGQDAGTPRSRRWAVDDWSARSPELNFDAQGRLFAIVWPRAYQVLP